jgi:hypothetical protein
MALRQSKVTGQGHITFEDMHRELFKIPPAPRTLDELKRAVREHLRKKHVRRKPRAAELPARY